MAARPTIARPDLLPPFEQVEASTTSGMAIAAELREAVLNDYADGEMIGSEDDLIVRFSVSRPTMRQAVRILQAEGLITVRRGLNGGMFARVPDVDTVSRSLSVLLRHRGATVSQLLEAILPVANALIASAAAHPDAARRAQAAASIQAYEPSEHLDEVQRTMHAAGNLAFHVNSLIDNPALALVAHVMLNLLRGGLAGGPTGQQPYYDRGRAFNLALADAIAKGEPQTATSVHEEMLAEVRSWLP